MRTEIADFLSPGVRAPARAGLDRAKEPKERFVLPSEPVDRGAARAEPAARAEAPSERGREAAERADPATVAAERAVDRAAPQSALRRGESSPTTPVANPEGGPLADGASPEAAPDPSLDPSIALLPDAPAGSPPAAGADAAATDPLDPALLDQAASAAVAGTQPGAAPPPVSEAGAGDAAPAPDAPAPDAPGPDAASAGADPAADPRKGGAEADVAGEAPVLLAPPEALAVAALAAGEGAPVVDDAAAPIARLDGRAVGAAPNDAGDPARGASVDGRVAAEAARAMRGPASPDLRPAEPDAQAAEEAGAEPGDASTEKGENVRTASADAASPSGAALEETRAPAAANGASERGFGLLGPAFGAADAPESGADAAIRALQQAAGSQPAALQAEAAGAAETGRPTIVVPQTALAAVPMAIGLKALNGVSNFQIRLDPAELGRIDVSLEIDGEGNVNAKLVVERVETLQLLQRDARTLERAFEQAGLKPSDGGIDLSLRDSGGERRNGREGSDEPRANAYGRAGSSGEESVAVDPRAHAALAAQAALRRALGGVDLRI